MTRSITNPAMAIRDLAAKAPDSPALIFPETRYSFAQLWDLISAFAARMRQAGVGQGSALTLVGVAEQEITLTAMFAASALGATFVQNPGNIDLSGVISGPLHRFTTDPQHLTGGEVAMIDASWSPATVREELSPPPLNMESLDPDAHFIVAHSSGTTGLAKLMAFTPRMMVLRSEAVADQFVAGQTVLCSLFPAISRPFVSRTMGALLNGCAVAVGREPDFWLRAGVTMISASPIQARAVFSETVLSPRLPLIEIPGSRVDDDLAHLLFKSFDRIDNAYGAGETNKTYSNIRTLSADGTIEVAGRKRDSMVEIVDAEGNPCAPGELGNVRIRNPYTVSGYLNDPAAEARAFRDGWFYPGDIARWGPGDALEISNREDDVVNIGGYKTHALAIDRVIAEVQGVRDAVVFKNPKSGAKDELFAFILLEEGASQLQVIASARHQITKQLGPEMVPRVFRQVGGIPRRPDGGPDRLACARLVLSIAEGRAQDDSAENSSAE